MIQGTLTAQNEPQRITERTGQCWADKPQDELAAGGDLYGQPEIRKYRVISKFP